MTRVTAREIPYSLLPWDSILYRVLVYQKPYRTTPSPDEVLGQLSLTSGVQARTKASKKRTLNLTWYKPLGYAKPASRFGEIYSQTFLVT